MRHDFSGFTPQRLSRLFPVVLAPYTPAYHARYEKEKTYLSAVFGESLVRISHIGSTAVAELLAKPTIDILLEVYEGTVLDPFTETLLEAGYVVNTPPGDRILYLKGYTPSGFSGQAMHIHVRDAGDWGELYFRDYLMAHPEAAKEYAALKQSLLQRLEYDRDGYTDAKGEFVRRVTTLARSEFPGRYTPPPAST